MLGRGWWVPAETEVPARQAQCRSQGGTSLCRGGHVANRRRLTPDSRDLLLSRGAALHHLRVALGGVHGQVKNKPHVSH
jgi:hypothetical protein